MPKNMTVGLAQETAGVEFIDENGGAPGVRLRKTEAEEGLGRHRQPGDLGSGLHLGISVLDSHR
jgi:hypothetical protein